jgi:hypothetical protein
MVSECRVRSLMILVLSQGQSELDQCVVFRVSCSEGLQVRLSWGLAGAIPMH